MIRSVAKLSAGRVLTRSVISETITGSLHNDVVIGRVRLDIVDISPDLKKVTNTKPLKSESSAAVRGDVRCRVEFYCFLICIGL